MKRKFDFADVMAVILSVLFVGFLIALPFAVVYGILSYRYTSQIIVTDAGDVIPYDPTTCNIIENTRTIVVKNGDSIITYSYIDWYYIDTVVHQSRWDRLKSYLEKLT